MSRIPEAAFYTWFSNLELVSFEKDRLTIGTPNSFVLDYVSHHYKTEIEAAGSAIAESKVKVHFINLDKSCNSRYPDEQEVKEVEEANGTAPQTATVPVAKSPGNGTMVDSTFPLNETYTFDNFVVGDCNQLAHAASRAVAEAPNNNNFNPLILYGGTGLGKTHILQAITHFALDAETAHKVVYRTSEEFTREYIEYVHKNKDSRSFYHLYKNADILLIDDIQFLAGKKSTQEEFFNIFNTLQQMNKQIVITSDRLPSAIKGLQGRLLARFDTGLLANMQRPNLETRLAILRKKNEGESHFFITDEVLSYIANCVTTSVRELEGTLIKLYAYAKFNHAPITVDICKQILGDTIRNVNKPVTIKSILERVAREFNVPAHHLTSQSRKKEVAFPRQIAMYLARQQTDNSLHTIGLAFGRDYSTVIHSLKKVENLLVSDEAIAKRINRLRSEVLESAI